MRCLIMLFIVPAAIFLVAGCGCDFGDWGSNDSPCINDRCGFWSGVDCGDCSSSSSGCDSSSGTGYCGDQGYCVEPDCGNGVLETGEACELDGLRPCTEIDVDTYLDGTASCASDCSDWDTSSCIRKNWCGNGILEEDEFCESGQTVECAILDPDAYLSGTAQCDDYCVWNDTSCVRKNICGNEVVETDGGEVCERYDAIFCTALDPDAYVDGTANCRFDCFGWELSGCVLANVCGNGVAEGEEVCDTFYAQLCAILDGNNYSGGNAYCKGDCTGWDMSACVTLNRCGNGIIDDPSEECDAGMGIPCVEIDPVQYVYGTAACNGECSGWSTANCLGHDVCGNGLVESDETCEPGGTIPCTDLDPVGYLPGNAPCKSDCTDWDTSLCAKSEICGNGIIEMDELCDTLPTSCTGLDPVKWGSGNAQCRADCGGWVTDGCLDIADPDDMVDIPGGTFSMGCDPQRQNDCLAMEQPPHTVVLSPYTIDRYEVSVAQYRLCVAAGKCSGNMYGTFAGMTACNIGSGRDPRMPANCISWNGAAAYCAWKKERLPTEAEWEFAARGTGASAYPWGDQAADCGRAVFDKGGPGCTTDATFAVGSFPKGRSPFDLHDMAGNVREWVADRYSATYYWSSEKNDPQGPATGDMRVLRGGSWRTDERSLKSYARYANDPAVTYTDLGFRCAK